MEAESLSKNLTSLPTEIVAELRHLVEAIHDDNADAADGLSNIEYTARTDVTAPRSARKANRTDVTAPRSASKAKRADVTAPRSASKPRRSASKAQRSTPAEVPTPETVAELVPAQRTSAIQPMAWNSQSRLVDEPSVVLVLPNDGGDAVLEVEAPLATAVPVVERVPQPDPLGPGTDGVARDETAMIMADLDHAMAFDPADEVQGWFVKRADQRRTHHQRSSRLTKISRLFRSDWQFYLALMLFVAGLVFVTLAVVLGWSPGS